MLRILHCLDNPLTNGGKAVSPTHRPRFSSRNIIFLLLIHISVRVNPRAYCGKLKKINSPDSVSNPQPPDLYNSALTTTHPRHLITYRPPLPVTGIALRFSLAHRSRKSQGHCTLIIFGLICNLWTSPPDPLLRGNFSPLKKAHFKHTRCCLKWRFPVPSVLSSAQTDVPPPTFGFNHTPYASCPPHLNHITFLNKWKRLHAHTCGSCQHASDNTIRCYWGGTVPIDI
jgi:hypothetical protein